MSFLGSHFYVRDAPGLWGAHRCDDYAHAFIDLSESVGFGAKRFSIDDEQSINELEGDT